MAKQSLAALKATNKDFNNVLDSMMNLTDGGTVTGRATFNGGAANKGFIKVTATKRYNYRKLCK